MVMPIRKNRLRTIGEQHVSYARIKGKETITIVFAGVGSPIKLCNCRLSKLNLASLMAEKMVTRKPMLDISFIKFSGISVDRQAS